MAETAINSNLNTLLINLTRSLLQYVGEASPWSQDGAETEQRTIDDLVARQRAQVAALTEFLSARNWPIDFGSYPTEYTDLHYVALDYLLSQVIDNEESLVGDLEGLLETCADDAEVVSLLEPILAEQRAIVSKLKELAASCAKGSAA